MNEPCNDVLVFPPNLVAQSSDRAILSPRLQSEYSQRLWYYHPLFLVIWRWDSFENLETFHSGGTTSGLVRYHASDGLVEDTGRSAEMERT